MCKAATENSLEACVESAKRLAYTLTLQHGARARHRRRDRSRPFLRTLADSAINTPSRGVWQPRTHPHPSTDLTCTLPLGLLQSSIDDRLACFLSVIH